MSDQEGCMVGYDCPIEWLNGAITAGVQSHVSLERIENFIHVYPMYQHNHHIIRQWSMPGRARYIAFMKDMDTDVNSLKAMFIEQVGADWLSVINCRTWQKSQPPAPQLIDVRDVTPWNHVNTTMTRGGSDSVSVFVANTVRRLTGNYYYWRP